MKYLVFFVLLVGMVSCEKDKAETGTVKIKAVYSKTMPDLSVVTNPDAGSKVYVFKDVNVGASGLSFDGEGTIKNATQTFKANQELVLDNQGEANISLDYGVYGFICVSKNKSDNVTVYWRGQTITLSSGSRDIDFKFD